MKKSLLFAAAALFFFSTPLVAQSAAPAAVPETHRETVDDFAVVDDRPTAPIRVSIPARPTAIASEKPEIGDGLTEAPPVEEIPVEVPVEIAPVIPTFFGEPVIGRVVFVLDRSASMGQPAAGISAIEDHNDRIISTPTRMQVVKAEVSRALMGMTAGNYFGIITFGGYPTTSADPFLLEATSTNVAAAVNKVQLMAANGPTPTLTALDLATRQYGSELNTLFLMSDGLPNCGQEAPVVLGAFPTKFEPLAKMGCRFVAVHMGPTEDGGMEFMQQLANSVDGTFQHR